MAEFAQMFTECADWVTVSCQSSIPERTDLASYVFKLVH